MLKTSEIEKSKPYVMLEMLEYVPNSLINKVVVSKTTGSITAISSDSRESTPEKIHPFDTFLQVIDGNVEVRVDHKSHFLVAGQFFIIPAHYRHTIKSDARFKMLSTVIKSGYEDAV